MKDPFNPGIAIGNIQLLEPAGDRSELVNGDWLPMKNLDSYMIRAQQRRVRGRNKEAIDDYNKALEIAPNNGDLHFCKGQTYVAMDKKEDAIAAFKTAEILFRKAGIDRESAARRWIGRLQRSQ
ncbi:tetratricopeptide repeat protein [cf. Phormidesmis sp. LEGE 11477]|uniref:tetratricopeptide repeat protein n=1 Tax=cf. Phormidesmis sp. LEGE 11477 TaxID=1828680 RepID=UPI001880029A|nr:tetratricopeptide repeat protein [cf. Phormidesmis sp. LEGE 11477]MBE9060338.1 tetratricopeptide repeat protein [cf. Phormidesmis sp. LEGE 11477]